MPRKKKRSLHGVESVICLVANLGQLFAVFHIFKVRSTSCDAGRRLVWDYSQTCLQPDFVGDLSLQPGSPTKSGLVGSGQVAVVEFSLKRFNHIQKLEVTTAVEKHRNLHRENKNTLFSYPPFQFPSILISLMSPLVRPLYLAFWSHMTTIMRLQPYDIKMDLSHYKVVGVSAYTWSVPKDFYIMITTHHVYLNRRYLLC